MFSSKQLFKSKTEVQIKTEGLEEEAENRMASVFTFLQFDDVFFTLPLYTWQCLQVQRSMSQYMTTVICAGIAVLANIRKQQLQTKGQE